MSDEWGGEGQRGAEVTLLPQGKGDRTNLEGPESELSGLRGLKGLRGKAGCERKGEGCHTVAWQGECEKNQEGAWGGGGGKLPHSH